MAPRGEKSVSGGDGDRLGRELVGLFAIFCGLLLVLSLITFDGRDPWLNHAISGRGQIHNRAGLFGAYISGLLFDMLGIAAWVIPAFFCLAGTRRILNSSRWDWWRWASFLLLVLCLASVGATWDLEATLAGDGASGGRTLASSHGGGLLGHLVYASLVGWLGATGAFLLWIFALILGFQMLVGFSWLLLAISGAKAAWKLLSAPFSAGRPALLERMPRLWPAKDSASAPQDEQSEGMFSALKETSPPLAPYSPLPDASAGMTDDLRALEEDIPPWVQDFEQESQAPAGLAVVDKYASFPAAAAVAESSASSARAVPPESAGPSEESGSAKAFSVAEEGRGVQKPIPASAKAFRQTGPQRGKSFRQPLPEADLLDPVPPNSNAAPRSQLEAKGRTLMACLADFGVLGELVGITPGPVVTMFEIRPAPGVRVARIASLSDDLALALKAVAVRIQAPVPGTDTVGIEIPNESREVVYLRELIVSRAFQEAQSLLSVALGKDIAGGPAVADLGAMPHLLIAGATGAGKSVGINSIILSFLYKAGPEEVKLLLIDPKRVEMAVYADLPHLVHPVVTDVPLAKNALDWAVREMERRYEDMAKAGVRSIAGYNAKLASFGARPPEDLQDLAPFPYLVIIIDELADLMLVGSKEVETSVVRLAQLARAAGIHLIL
ncbi:MAG: DNA translocase FtsK, partial [Deltaproteobacteria bacterium]|nr:DNA translocase FtsK [Deltaproteobacteria bacterium]